MNFSFSLFVFIACAINCATMVHAMERIQHVSNFTKEETKLIRTLFSAIAKNDRGIVLSLIPNCLSANVQDPDGIWDSPLACAASYGYVRVMGYLIDNKANINHAGKNKRTALHIAVEKGYTNAVELLMVFGANSEVEDGKHITPLGLALEKGTQEIINLLIPHQNYTTAPEKTREEKLKEEFQSNIDKLNSMLFQAVAEESIPLIALALKNGAQVNAVDKDNKNSSVLHLAASINNLEIMKYLVAQGANPNAISLEKISVLHIATYHDNIKMMTFLIEKGACLDAQDDCGVTALHRAVGTNKEKAAHLLITSGINVTLTNKLGKKAADLCKNKSMLLYLINAAHEYKKKKLAPLSIEDAKKLNEQLIEAILKNNTEHIINLFEQGAMVAPLVLLPTTKDPVQNYEENNVKAYAIDVQNYKVRYFPCMKQVLLTSDLYETRETESNMRCIVSFSKKMHQNAYESTNKMPLITKESPRFHGALDEK